MPYRFVYKCIPSTTNAFQEQVSWTIYEGFYEWSYFCLSFLNNLHADLWPLLNFLKAKFKKAVGAGGN